MHAIPHRRRTWIIDLLLVAILLALTIATFACSAMPPYASLGITWTTLPPGARAPMTPTEGPPR